MPDAPFPLRFTADGATIIRARATITAETLFIEPTEPEGPPISVDFAEIETAEIGQVDIAFSTLDGTVYHLSHLAERFDPFAAAFTAARNERWIRGLLYRDQKVEREFRGEVEHEGDGKPVRDRAVLRLYPSSFVALCATSDPFSVSFNDVRKVSFDDGAYALRVALNDGGTVSLYKLGERFDEFEKIINRLRDDLLTRVAAGLQAILPMLGEGAAASLARTAGHGRAFTRAEAESAAPGYWEALVGAVLGTADLHATFAYLSAGVAPEDIFLGIAIDADADMNALAAHAAPPAPDMSAVSAGPPTVPVPSAPDDPPAVDSPVSPYTSWFLVTRRTEAKLAFEVTSEAGHATYVFRIDPSRAADDARSISRALVALNFAREPIYMPEDQLSKGIRRRYQLALRKLPYLRDLRERFVGRAIHNAGWPQQVDALLRS